MALPYHPRMCPTKNSSNTVSRSTLNLDSGSSGGYILQSSPYALSGSSTPRSGDKNCSTDLASFVSWQSKNTRKRR